MIATIIIIALAFIWLLKETNYLTIRLETTEYQRQQAESVKVKADMSQPILALPASNPANYLITLTTTVKELKSMIDQLSKTELELTEEVYSYDYSEQA